MSTDQWAAMTEEQYCHEALAALRESYERAAKPYIARLVAIECRKTPQPIFVTISHASQLGFMSRAAPAGIEPTP